MTALERAECISPTDKELLREIKQIIRGEAPEADVLLYGSLARGTAGAESDYDILVLTPHKLSSADENAIYDAVYRFEVERDVVVSIVFYSREEWDSPIIRASPYYMAVLRDGVTV